MVSILNLPSATPQTSETALQPTASIIDSTPPVMVSRLPVLRIYKTENGYKVSAGHVSIDKATHSSKEGVA